ncbi:MAG: hypothetical protein AAFO82_18680 [Bacteroidota bacterium]
MSIPKLNLYELKANTYVPSPRVSDYYAEAATVCMDNQNHQQSVEIKVIGDVEATLQLTWEEVTQQIKDSWNDLQEATEYGATCIAILLIQTLTDKRVTRRSPKETGFDYWLGDKKDDFPFQDKARLEVSGILKGTTAQVNQRVKEKVEQTKRTDNTALPAYIVVVEFSTPICKVVIR